MANVLYHLAFISKKHNPHPASLRFLCLFFAVRENVFVEWLLKAKEKRKQLCQIAIVITPHHILSMLLKKHTIGNQS
jgi:hypothetical protein